MTLSDQEAVQKIKNGEIDSFSVIVEHYTVIIYRYVRAKLFDKTNVDDLVQNIFVSFYKAISRFDETRPILPYLFQIARNELKMYYRSHKETMVLDESITVDSDKNDYYKEDYETLMNQLSEGQKKVLQLLQEGYSYKEIADKVQKPINTVRTIIRRSRLQVKKLYYEKA